jgi:hypothetical protein
MAQQVSLVMQYDNYFSPRLGGCWIDERRPVTREHLREVNNLTVRQWRWQQNIVASPYKILLWLRTFYQKWQLGYTTVLYNTPEHERER